MLSQFSRRLKYVLILVLILIVALTGTYLLHQNRQQSAKNQVSIRTGCIAQTFNVGASGSCVRDIQTMVNFIETDGMTECPFIGSQQLTLNGNYDNLTKNQIQVIQQWENCYNKQEGSTLIVNDNGIVSTPTWSELCTYAYLYPSRSGSSVSSYRQASLAAGKDANCSQLL